MERDALAADCVGDGDGFDRDNVDDLWEPWPIMEATLEGPPLAEIALGLGLIVLFFGAAMWHMARLMNRGRMKRLREEHPDPDPAGSQELDPM